jgi:hypothetical protein
MGKTSLIATFVLYSHSARFNRDLFLVGHVHLAAIACCNVSQDLRRLPLEPGVLDCSCCDCVRRAFRIRETSAPVAVRDSTARLDGQVRQELLRLLCVLGLRRIYRCSEGNFGALPYRVRNVDLGILLITTRKKRRWSVPKSWLIKRSTPQQTAMFEAYEEAGCGDTSAEFKSGASESAGK